MTLKVLIPLPLPRNIILSFIYYLRQGIVVSEAQIGLSHYSSSYSRGKTPNLKVVSTANCVCLNWEVTNKGVYGYLGPTKAGL